MYCFRNKKDKDRLFVINTDVPFTYRFRRHEILVKIFRSLNLKVDNHLCSKLKTHKFLISCGISVNHIIEVILFYLSLCMHLLYLKIRTGIFYFATFAFFRLTIDNKKAYTK